MAKRIPKTLPPEQIRVKLKNSSFKLFCEVYIPQAPSIFTYGIPNDLPIGVEVRRGSVVWVQFSTRKKSTLALVSKVFSEPPAFDVRCVYPHASGYIFSARYMDLLEWLARYYVSSPMKTLSVFWPSNFENYLDASIVFKSEFEKISLEQKEFPPLTDEQQTVLNALVKELLEKGFRKTLLHGVTGSGKTRVYQELASEALKLGLKVLILVPEIGLTSQTSKRFEEFLHIPIQVLHSALSIPKKRSAYVSILNNKAQVVLGTRSAILAPFDFDLVILDEEHDSSFKQQDPAPRYHTRDIAFYLAHKYGAFVVLGSATPCMESYYNAISNNIKYLSLSKRATSASLPNVKIIDMTKIRQQKGILMSPELRDALVKCVMANEQAIVLMNRRGYSKIRVCTNCGETLYCKNCHVPLVYHKQYNSLLCHYCGILYPFDTPCDKCGSETYEFMGGAIEKLEEEIMEWVPNAKIIRMDRDTTQNVGSIDFILNSFRNREYNVLLGTQMVAKGHDFPGVQLVGIVGADSGLGVPDFRSSERLFQLLSQTAGRAGRLQGGGNVYIQTLNPSEPIMQFALHHDFSGFAKKELRDRKEAFYPPYCKLIEVSFGSKDKQLLENSVKRVEYLCRLEKSLKVLGPVDAFVSKIQNIYWVKLYLKTNNLSVIRRIFSPITNSKKNMFPGVEIKVEIE